jgi:hypothetical protein
MPNFKRLLTMFALLSALLFGDAIAAMENYRSGSFIGLQGLAGTCLFDSGFGGRLLAGRHRLDL